MTSERTKQIAVLYLAIVFIAGAAFGFAVSEFYSAKSAEAVNQTNLTALQYRQKLVEDLDHALHLNASQINEILVVLDDVGERFHAVRDAMEPEFEAIRSDQAARIMAVLDDEQRAKYKLIVEEKESRREERRRLHREQLHKE